MELTDKVGEFMKDVKIERDWCLLKKRLPQWQEYNIIYRRDLLCIDSFLATMPRCLLSGFGN